MIAIVILRNRQDDLEGKNIDELLRPGKVQRVKEQQSSATGSASESSFLLTRWESLYLGGLILVEVYSLFLHVRIFKDQLPFLPLMLISVYCAIGIVWAWSQPDIEEVTVVKQE